MTLKAIRHGLMTQVGVFLSTCFYIALFFSHSSDHYIYIYLNCGVYSLRVRAQIKFVRIRVLLCLYTDLSGPSTMQSFPQERVSSRFCPAGLSGSRRLRFLAAQSLHRRFVLHLTCALRLLAFFLLWHGSLQDLLRLLLLLQQRLASSALNGRVIARKAPPPFWSAAH